jgi:alkyldihydroxyacetonephosphate synthase
VTLSIDRKSLLVQASAETTLGSLERSLATTGLTLGLGTALDPRMTVATFLERGGPGAKSPWSDPSDHLVAGLTAVEKKAPSGRAPRRLDVRPAPRRAVGPDLISLVVGQGGRFFELQSAWLRVHPKTEIAAATKAATFVAPEEPPVNDAEARLLDAMSRELSR